MTEIRRASAADRAELIRMRQALWPDSTAGEVDELLAGAVSAYAVLVATRAGGRLHGFVEVGERRFAEGCSTSPVAYLEGIWVDADLRRTGVGLALVAKAREWARSRGLTELASDCAVENSASLAFHAAAGFREVMRLVAFQQWIQPGPDSPSGPSAGSA